MNGGCANEQTTEYGDFRCAWLVKHKLQRSPGTLGPALRELQAVAVTEAKDALL